MEPSSCSRVLDELGVLHQPSVSTYESLVDVLPHFASARLTSGDVESAVTNDAERTFRELAPSLVDEGVVFVDDDAWTVVAHTRSVRKLDTIRLFVVLKARERFATVFVPPDELRKLARLLRASGGRRRLHCTRRGARRAAVAAALGGAVLLAGLRATRAWWGMHLEL